MGTLGACMVVCRLSPPRALRVVQAPVQAATKLPLDVYCLEASCLALQLLDASAASLDVQCLHCLEAS